MRSIELEDRDFARLQAYAEPLVDTPAGLVKRLLDLHEASLALASPSPRAAVEGAVVYGRKHVPPLRHAKILDAQLGESRPAKMTWDALLRLALFAVFDRYRSVDELRRVSGANVVARRKLDEGYKYVDDRDFSYQGVSADDAMKIICRCVTKLDIPAYIEFEWQTKDGAYRPGERATLVLDASPNAPSA